MMTEVRWDRDRTFTVKEHLHTKVGFVPGFGCGKAHSHYHGNQCLEGREFSNNQATTRGYQINRNALKLPKK